MLKLDNNRKTLYQWDVGVIGTLTIDGVDEVHFSNLRYGVSFNIKVVDNKVEFPPEVLQSGADVFCWAFVREENGGYTKKEQFFNVEKRPRPADYVYEPTEILSWETLNENKEDKANKLTEYTEVETDKEFYSAKAVNNIVNSISGGGGGGTVSPTSILKTLKCGIMGDSITYGAGVNHNTESYPALLKADFKEVINYGQNATLIAKNDNHGNPMCERYVNMADDLDVIIVMGGTNDFAAGSSVGTFGEPDSTDPYTFYGALNVLMAGLVEKYVGKEIFFCTPIHINYNGLKSGDIRANGKNLYDYRNAIIERCAAHSIPCIDIFAISGMNIEQSETAKDYFTWDGCHPNATGHIRLHDRILHEVTNRIGYNTQATGEVPTVKSISAVFNQGNTAIYTDTNLNSLKDMLTVTATYTDGTTAIVTDYTLNGTLEVGTSVITVSYSGKTTTFTANVSETVIATLESISAVYNQGEKVVYTTDSLEILKDDLTVTAYYDDETNAIVSDYELSGDLTEGTATITVSYKDKTATFIVNVTKYELNLTFYEYLQGDENSYIDTGIKPNQNTKFEIKVSKTDAGSGRPAFLEAWGGSEYFGINANASQLYWCWNNSYPVINNGYATVGEHIFTNDKGTLYDNGVGINTIDYAEFSMEYSLFMFANNSSGNATNIANGSNRIYYCKIWDGNTLVRDFVPAKRDTDNAIGMYDKVTNTFFENKGTGTFGTGEVVTE